MLYIKIVDNNNKVKGNKMIEAIGTLLGLLGIALCFSLAIVGGCWFGWNVVNLFTGGELNRILGGK